MHWSVGRKIGASFGVVLLITVVIGAAAYNSTAQLLESETSVTHTHRVLTNLAQVMSSLVDAETGQRGYIITGNDRFLEPYRTAGQTVSSELERLKKSIPPTPSPVKSRVIKTPVRSSSIRMGTPTGTTAEVKQKSRGVLSLSRLNMLAKPKGQA